MSETVLGASPGQDPSDTARSHSSSDKNLRSEHSRESRRFDIAAVVILITLGAVIPLLIAQSAGALKIPRSDDWSYLTTLFRWVGGDGLSFNNWVSMTLVGQLVLAAPVAALARHSIGAVHVETALLGAVGLIALYYVGVRVLQRRSAALLVAITMTLSPLWVAMAPTFMSDIPSFALQMLMTAAGVKGLLTKSRRIPWLVATVALGVAGCSIRQFAIVPLIAVLLAFAVIAKRDGDRALMRAAIASGIIAFLAIGVLMIWWSGIPDPLKGAPMDITLGSLREATARGIGYLRLCGLLLLPVLAYVGPIRVAKRAWRASALTTTLVAALTTTALILAAATLGEDAFVGNYIHPRGVLADDVLVGTRPFLIARPAWLALVILGSLGAVVIMLCAVPAYMRAKSRLLSRNNEMRSHREELDPIAVFFGLTLLGLFAAYVSTDALQINRFPIFDRYVITGLPLIALLILRDMSLGTSHEEQAQGVGRRIAPSRAVAIISSLLLLASLGTIWGVDSARYDATRWQVSKDAVAKGFNPLHIDGGFEWVAWHLGRAAVITNTESERRVVRARSLAPLCVTVAVNAPNLSTKTAFIASRSYTTLLGQQIRIIAVRNKRECGGRAP
jgi:4-amino-4-deoxy-L-arabinose transferase-like glycosyltransferase